MSLADLKQKIKDDVPISNVIGSYLAIKKSGTSMVSLCPFHVDSNPSMHINDSRKIYKCFACGAAGDAITFVMKHRNLEYIDALKEICDKQGIHFESYLDEKKSNPKIEMGKKILSKTAQLYRKMATTNNYLPYPEFIKNRGLNEETATTYCLGFASSDNSLFKYLSSIPDEKERKFALEVAKELTLIKTNPNNPDNHYDTFRDRIIFPIWDHAGHVIGFTSRAIRADQEPKYMNSKDSFLFNKSNLLYGFHLAKNSIREKDLVILVEGNMDQIALYHYGFKNSVAIMGTALGAQSLDRLLTLTKNVVLALDTDGAGYKAMKRINQQFAEKGIIAKYIEFSPEKDPDEFLKNHGALKLQEKIEMAKACYDILLDEIIPTTIPEVVDRKLEILNHAFEIISPLELQLSATERIINFSKKIGLKADSNQVTQSYSEFLQKKNRPLLSGRANIVPNKPNTDKKNEESEKINEDIIQLGSIISPIREKKSLTKIEKLLVQELVQVPSILAKTNITELLDLVSSIEVKNYIGKVTKLYLEIDESEYATVILNLIDSAEYSMDLKEAVADALFKYKPREIDSKTRNRLVHDLKAKLQSEKLINKKEELKELQKTSETQDEINKLFLEISDIEKKLQAIKKNKPEQKY